MIIKTTKLYRFNEQDVVSYEISNTSGFTVEILNLGGIITKIMAPDYKGNFENVVVGYKDIKDYIENKSYFGAIIGRTSGRIHKGSVNIDGNTHKLSINDGSNQCHGGFQGLNRKIWDAEILEGKNNISLKLSTISHDGEEGYPGNIKINVTYIVDENNNLEIVYEGCTDKTTLINLTNHTYFNLSGNIKEPITNQYLKIDSDYLVEITDDLVPTGNLISVENTPFDFKKLKCIGKDIDSKHYQIQAGNGYDHPWILNSSENQIFAYDSKSKRTLTMTTDQKVVVFYSMNFKTEEALYNDKTNQRRYAMCLETQSHPIGVDECFKERSILNKGEVYRHNTKFSFGIK